MKNSCALHLTGVLLLMILIRPSLVTAAGGDNLWQIKWFGCDFGHENTFLLQRSGAPVCGISPNCPGPPRTCWGPPVTARSHDAGSIRWTIGSQGQLDLWHAKDNQVYGHTFLFSYSATTLTVPV